MPQGPRSESALADLVGCGACDGHADESGPVCDGRCVLYGSHVISPCRSHVGRFSCTASVVAYSHDDCRRHACLMGEAQGQVPHPFGLGRELRCSSRQLDLAPPVRMTAYFYGSVIGFEPRPAVALLSSLLWRRTGRPGRRGDFVTSGTAFDLVPCEKALDITVAKTGDRTLDLVDAREIDPDSQTRLAVVHPFLLQSRSVAGVGAGFHTLPAGGFSLLCRLLLPTWAF